MNPHDAIAEELGALPLTENDVSDGGTSSKSILPHPLIQLAVITLTFTGMLRLLFFHFARQIWAMQADVPLQDITPWTRSAMLARDGIEPPVLLALILLLTILTVLSMQLLERFPQRLRIDAVLVCTMTAALFAMNVRLRAPNWQPGRSWWQVFEAEAGIFLAILLTRWAARKRGLHVVLGLALTPVCFLAVSLPSHSDLACILAPALKLRLGFSPAQIYMQYDYLLSLLGVGWHSIGGDPFAFSRVTEVSFFLLLVASYLLARHMFEEKRLAGMLLVALCVVRVYGIVPDANFFPQVTPLRIDLWLLLLAPALIFDLRHWSVGLAAGLVYFFARSFGFLYLGSYALALSADFLMRHADARERIPLWREVADYVRPTTAGLVFVGASLLAARWVFGATVSDAVVTYRRLGIGMLRISPDSFYWWIAPALAATAWLVFSLRGVIGQRRTGASFFLLALGIGNSIYFFGRSHEQNLLNISAPLLFCVFLGMDLAIVAWGAGPVWVRWMVHAAPWLTLGFIGFFYAGRLVAKIQTQFDSVTGRQAVIDNDHISPIVCEEIAGVAQDSRVFVYDSSDYWFYEKCGYVPPGYIQPILLQPLRVSLIEQLDQLLNTGYKIIVPKTHATGFDFSDVEPSLKGLERTETVHYDFYYRKP
jgi:hypothetical protein